MGIYYIRMYWDYLPNSLPTTSREVLDSVYNAGIGQLRQIDLSMMFMIHEASTSFHNQKPKPTQAQFPCTAPSVLAGTEALRHSRARTLEFPRLRIALRTDLGLPSMPHSCFQYTYFVPLTFQRPPESTSFRRVGEALDVTGCHRLYVIFGCILEIQCARLNPNPYKP